MARRRSPRTRCVRVLSDSAPARGRSTCLGLRLSDLGEFGFLAELARRGLAEEIGDDTAVLPGGLVVTQDALVEDIHFRLDWTSWRDLGYKAAAVNVSDLAAAGRIQRHSSSASPSRRRRIGGRPRALRRHAGGECPGAWRGHERGRPGLPRASRQSAAASAFPAAPARSPATCSSSPGRSAGRLPASARSSSAVGAGRADPDASPAAVPGRGGQEAGDRGARRDRPLGRARARCRAHRRAFGLPARDRARAATARARNRRGRRRSRSGRWARTTSCWRGRAGRRGRAGFPVVGRCVAGEGVSRPSRRRASSSSRAWITSAGTRSDRRYGDLSRARARGYAAACSQEAHARS